ncbi:hypothetical protein [Helicobacter ailurogastricus]|uniref:hypothetical protein n=1 Tax=Helicobacter ailurogastricus TaxID=1578720 RepID=UPI0022BC5C37|nr:hypothetical protein [Helicobacter ailurogastricus]GLH58120.1 hypothetical protein NHP214376_09090 [Helicobacter ailurogastricus]GLH58945.1 hypothetical protein NHP214377_02090 [Helicobacter ailurogastricus]
MHSFVSWSTLQSPHTLAGVRAQAVSKSGELIEDFLFCNSARSVNVCNAPSPAATSAIPIGQHILEQLEGMMG